MDALVNPYEIGVQGPGVMAAILLARQGVTFLPTSLDERPGQTLQQAVALSPRLERLMLEWAWTTPLWRTGVLATTDDIQGRPLADEIRDVHTRIVADPSLAPLASLIEGAADQGDARYLDALCKDLIRGGGDPAISIPLSAGLERFAAARGFLLFHGPAGSIMGRLEQRLGAPVFSTTLPIVTAGGGAALLAARETLEHEIVELRSTFAEAIATMNAGASDDELAVFTRQTIEPAAAQYERAFVERRDEFSEGGRRGEAMVRLTCVRLPPDATLTAAFGAATAMGVATTPSAEGPPHDPAAASSLSFPGALSVAVKLLPWDVGGSASN